MTPWLSMQNTVNPDTGFDDGAGIHPMGQQVQDRTLADHNVQQGLYLLTHGEEVPDQQSYRHPSPTSHEVLISARNLDAHDSGVLYKIISSDNSQLLEVILNLLLCDEPTFNHYHSLSRCGRPLESVHFLSPRLALVDEPTWRLFHALGGESRPILASYLQKKHNLLHTSDPGSANLRHQSENRRNSLANTLSPISVVCSSTSRSSSGSNSRLPANARCFCPDVDCTHKPDGFKKLGYLVNHVKTKHRSIMEDPDWEEKVEIRGQGDELPKRRGSAQHRKRPATPSTPGERAHKSTHMVLGLDTKEPKGNFSPSRLSYDLEDSSPQASRTRCDPQPARSVPGLMLNGAPTGVDYPESRFDFESVAFQNTSNLQPLRTSNFRYVDPLQWSTEMPTASSAPLFGESPYNRYGPPYVPGYGQTPYQQRRPPAGAPG